MGKMKELAAEGDKISALLAERQKTHGNFESNARVSQAIKAALRSGDKWNTLPDEIKEGLDMLAAKMCRMTSGDYRHADNVQDIMGYAELMLRSLSF